MLKLSRCYYITAARGEPWHPVTQTHRWLWTVQRWWDCFGHRNSGRTGTVKHTCGHLSGLFEWCVLNTKLGLSHTPPSWSKSGIFIVNCDLGTEAGAKYLFTICGPPAVRRAREQPERKETDTAGGETRAGGRVNKQTWDLFYAHLLFWLLFIWSWQDRADLDCWKGAKLTL